MNTMEARELDRMHEDAEPISVRLEKDRLTRFLEHVEHWALVPGCSDPMSLQAWMYLSSAR